jgi:hypothetical protein
MIRLSLRAARQQPPSLSDKAHKVFFPIRSLKKNIVANHPQPFGEFPQHRFRHESIFHRTYFYEPNEPKCRLLTLAVAFQEAKIMPQRGRVNSIDQQQALL